MPKNQNIKNPLLRFLDIVEMKLLTQFGIKWTIWWPKKIEKMGKFFADFPIQIAENAEKTTQLRQVISRGNRFEEIREEE